MFKRVMRLLSFNNLSRMICTEQNRKGTLRICSFAAVLALLASAGTARGALLSADFEGGTIPVGWTSLIQLGTMDWTVANPSVQSPPGHNPLPSAHSGSYAAMFNSFLALPSYSAWLVTPSLNMMGYSSVTLSFWMYHDTGYSSSNDRVTVYVSPNGVDWDAIGLTANRYGAVNQWRQETADLSSYIGNSAVQVGFFATAGFYGNSMFIDDVNVSESATPEPATVTLAGLGWTVILYLRRRR